MSREFIFTLEEIIKINDHRRPPLMSDGKLYTIQRTTGTAWEDSNGELEVIIDKQEILYEDDYKEYNQMPRQKRKDENLFKKIISKLVK